jgi:hypothetical protein
VKLSPGRDGATETKEKRVMHTNRAAHELYCTDCARKRADAEKADDAELRKSLADRSDLLTGLDAALELLSPGRDGTTERK